MVRVKMLKSFPVSPTGIRTVIWPKGSIQVTDSENIMNAMIENGACEIIEDKAEKPKLETSEPIAKPRRGKRKK